MRSCSFKSTFPPALTEKLDLENLEPDNTSYIDENLKEHFSDIVYTCNYNNETEIKITLLFEHKSYAVKYPRIQILKYMINIWETCEKQNKELTPVISLVLYHGIEKWNVKRFRDYFNDTDDILNHYIPEFDYILADLSSYTDDEIRNSMFKRVFLETALLLMKNINDDEVLESKLGDYFNICREYFEEEKGLKFLRSSIFYLYYTVNLEPENIIKATNKKRWLKYMNTKIILIKEIENLPESLAAEVLDFVRFLEHRKESTIESYIQSESSLKKDWLSATEDEAWKDL